MARSLRLYPPTSDCSQMDVTLAFIAHYYGGQDVARNLAKELEYDWREIAEGDKDPLYEKHYKV